MKTFFFWQNNIWRHLFPFPGKQLTRTLKSVNYDMAVLCICASGLVVERSPVPWVRFPYRCNKLAIIPFGSCQIIAIKQAGNFPLLSIFPCIVCNFVKNKSLSLSSNNRIQSWYLFLKKVWIREPLSRYNWWPERQRQLRSI